MQHLRSLFSSHFFACNTVANVLCLLNLCYNWFKVDYFMLLLHDCTKYQACGHFLCILYLCLFILRYNWFKIVSCIILDIDCTKYRRRGHCFVHQTNIIVLFLCLISISDIVRNILSSISRERGDSRA